MKKNSRLKVKAISVLALFVFFNGLCQEKSIISITYPKPYEYKQIEGKLAVKAHIKTSIKSTFKKVRFENGNTTNIQYNAKNTFAWFPIFGNPETIEFIDSKPSNNQKQLFTPLVTPDWGYFSEGTFHVISSSHQDIAWMDTPEVCRHERINEIIAPALDIMKTDGDYHFGMEQTLNLKEFIEEQPERKPEVLERYKEGRFTWGATYNQPYEGMQMGEQLIREMYLGKLWIKNNFDNVNEKTAYNTDVPGRSLQFPQILAKSGVENLFVSRMREGFYNWHSPDGSAVATYSPGNYGWAIMFYKFFEEDAIEALRKLQTRVKMWGDYYKKHNLPPHFAIVLSNDASGPSHVGPIIKEWNKIVDLADVKIPSLRHSTVTGFLSEMKQPGAKFEYLEGDRPNIWAYIHGPGHHKAISASREAGRILPSAEIFNTVDALVNNSFENYPTERLSKAFEESIYPDHGWGGKNGHVTDSIFKSKLEFAANEANSLLENSLKSISKKIQTEKDNAVIIFNDLSWERNGLVTINIDDAGTYYVMDENNKVVPSQVSATNKNSLYIHAPSIPSLGYKTLYLKRGKKSLKVEKSVLPNVVSNAFYNIHLGNGGITYLYDKVLNKEILNTTKFSGGDVLTLGYKGNGAGEFTQMTEPDMDGFNKTSNQSSLWQITNNGAVFTDYVAKTKFKHSEVVQKIRVFHQEKKIDFLIDLLNWDGTHNREFRFAIPLNMENSKIKFEQPMAIAEVGTSEMKNAPGGWAWGGTYDSKPETVHPREVLNFISAENDDLVVAMSTDVAVADWIDPTREAVQYAVLQGLLLASHKSCHGEGNWYHQTGDHQFKFSLGTSSPSSSFAYKFGTASNHPLRYIVKKEKSKRAKLPESMSFVNVSDPMVRISTIKKSEQSNDVILRLVEMEGKNKQPILEFSKPVSTIIKTNLIEEEEGQLKVPESALKIDIGHNAIDTYKLTFKN
ncbi:glycosyl hydrolase-related protein [Algibacter pectinivorans]|uniref:Alpha-mannosidase n=1 Tax=Algibacter pectinivorans TaxID=870482 RepID=A0A1I1M9Q2_9FLAO|nr:glycosyl hydrolase-related protein [Algibacter pectinivorans]SFC79928.1 alpha-mannosidase [Algibacter pectinivorans]